MPDAGLDPEPLPDQVRVGRRVTDPPLTGMALAFERFASAAEHWKAILGLAVLLWAGATALGNWIGWRTGAGPGKQLAELQAAQMRSDSLRTEGFRQVNARMDRIERMQTQQTLGQCVDRRRSEPDAWTVCNRELRDLLGQLQQ